jgi:oxygen-independent coproporphyrinogen-3 oxidase
LKELGFSPLELTKMVKPGRDDYRYIRILYGNHDLLPAGKGAGGKIGDYDVYHIQSDRSMISPINHRYAQYNLLLGYLQFGYYQLTRLRSLVDSPLVNAIDDMMNEYTEEGYLEKTGKNSWQLTPDGIFWGNNLSIDFLQRIIPQPEFIETGVGI